MSNRPIPTAVVAYPALGSISGGNGLTAWVLHALLEAGWRVRFLCIHRPNFDLMDRAFGTRLAVATNKLSVELALALSRWWGRFWPTHGASLDFAWIERHVAARLRHDPDCDLLIGTNNEWNAPTPAIQYVHYPRYEINRPDCDYRWFHRLPFALPAYRKLVTAISGIRTETWKQNCTLANSKFIAEKCRRVGLENIRILPPPAANDNPPKLWHHRENRFVVLGRLHPSKRILETLQILKQVRERGHTFNLRVVGPSDCDRSYFQRLMEFCDHNSWVEIGECPDRHLLGEYLADSRYGIHAMHEEHFGMAVAEMRRAGMVVFAHNSGGPADILRDQRLLFSNDHEAVEKISRVLASLPLAEEMHARALTDRESYSSRQFQKSFLQEVETWLDRRRSMVRET